MKKRIHLRKKKLSITSANKKNLFLLVFILVIISVVLFLNFINNKITPILLENAELEINKFSTIMINKAVSKVLEDQINIDELFSTEKNNDGSIQMIDFNPIVVNQILKSATEVVQNNLQLLENGDIDAIGIDEMNLSNDRIEDLENGIIFRIPLGVISDNSIISNLGPEIPVRLRFIGDVNSNITTKVTQYGINNAMVEVGVKLELTAQIILPLVTEKKSLDCNIPIAIKIIQGSVPNYYGNSLLKDSSLYSLPLNN